MNTYTLYLSSPIIITDTSTVLSAAPIKGQTLFTVDLTGFNESEYVVNNLRIQWGDTQDVYEYKRDAVPNYKEISIFNEVLYGKIGGSIAVRYDHVYNSVSQADITTYLLEIFAQYENGYRHDVTVYVPVYPESYYDTLDEMDLVTTQILGVSSNYTAINLESRKTGQTIFCVLST
jgi:hypothetical protein